MLIVVNFDAIFIKCNEHNNFLPIEQLLNKEKQIHAYEKRHTPQASHASKTPLGENNNNIPHTSSRIPCSNDQEKEDTVVLLKSLNKK